MSPKMPILPSACSSQFSWRIDGDFLALMVDGDEPGEPSAARAEVARAVGGFASSGSAFFDCEKGDQS